MKPAIKVGVTMRRTLTDGFYIIEKINGRITLEDDHRNTFRVGNTISEAEAEALNRIYDVMVLAAKGK